MAAVWGSGRSLRSSGTIVVSAGCAARQSCAMAESTPSGPNSRNAVTPWLVARPTTASANRTGSRTCRVQYSGAQISSALAGFPVSVDTIGSRGGWTVTSSATCWNSASMSSISGEWNAWLTRSHLVLCPRSASAAATCRTASISPEITVAAGPFTAATLTVSAQSASSGVTSSTPAWTATMPPPSGSACISRPRAATSAQASARDSTPATWAAASSPIEWPTRKSGRTPQCSTRRNRATSTANSAGWV